MGKEFDQEAVSKDFYGIFGDLEEVISNGSDERLKKTIIQSLRSIKNYTTHGLSGFDPIRATQIRRTKFTRPHDFLKHIGFSEGSYRTQLSFFENGHRIPNNPPISDFQAAYLRLLHVEGDYNPFDLDFTKKNFGK